MLTLATFTDPMRMRMLDLCKKFEGNPFCRPAETIQRGRARNAKETAAATATRNKLSLPGSRPLLLSSPASPSSSPIKRINPSRLFLEFYSPSLPVLQSTSARHHAIEQLLAHVTRCAAMEISASVEGRLRRREHRSGCGWFRSEIEVDSGSPSIPR